MTSAALPVITNLINGQKSFFSTLQTSNLPFRLEMLKSLKTAVLKYEKKIADALWTDLHKSYEEAYLTEISIVLKEIDNHIRHLKRWAKPKRVRTPLILFPSTSRIIYEPLGTALIMAPWNYPFQLLINPLIGAISAGCCAILKPSPYAQATAQVIDEMISKSFSPEYIGIVQGGREINKILLEQRFDFIFFSGSPSLGKLVMKAAAEHLTPVVLELGGKSPCIVDKCANIKIAAKRIAWGKTVNAGQTCIAPDYVFVHESLHDDLLREISVQIMKMYGPVIRESRHYPRIINQNAVERLQKLMLHGEIVFGGEVIPEEKYISPTLIKGVKPEYPVMNEEIFGPLLPFLTFSEISEVISYLDSNEKPLAFYYFGTGRKAKEILLMTTSGGGCINDTLLHFANSNLPFGGVGQSGMGRYHGHNSFLAFSNKRSIVTSSGHFDIPLKYPPFRRFKLLKRFFL